MLTMDRSYRRKKASPMSITALTIKKVSLTPDDKTSNSTPCQMFDGMCSLASFPLSTVLFGERVRR